MLVESDVVEAVCRYLQSLGYRIDQQLNPTQHGIDILASKDQIRLCVEAKGETSERAGSERHGKPFDRAEVGVHVAEAFYTAARLLAASSATEGVRIAMALPQNALHVRQVQPIASIIWKLQIALIWVHEDKTVDVVSPWSL